MSKQAAVKFNIDMSKLELAFSSISKGVDTLDKKFTNFDEQVKKSTGNFEQSIKRMLAAFGGITTLKAAIKDVFIEDGSRLAFLSMDTGESMEDLQAWGEAVKRFGGTAEGVQGSIKSLHDNLYKLARAGDREVATAFAFAEVDPMDSSGKIKKSSDLLLDLAEKFHGLSMEEARFRSRKLNLDEGTIRALTQGRTEVEKLLAVQKENAVLFDEDRDAVISFKAALLDSAQAMKRVAAIGARFLTPIFIGLSRYIEKFINYIAKNKHFIIAFFSSIAAMIALTLIPALVSLAAAQIAAFGPLLAIAAVIGLLFDDFKTWQQGGDSFFDWQGFLDFTDDLKPLLKIIQDVIASLGKISFKILTGEIGPLKKLFEGLDEALGFIVKKLVQLGLIKVDDPLVQKELEGLANDTGVVGQFIDHIFKSQPAVVAANVFLPGNIKAISEFADIATNPSKWFMRKDMSGGATNNVSTDVDINITMPSGDPLALAGKVGNVVKGVFKTNVLPYMFSGGSK